jgi:hypothetical protein
VAGTVITGAVDEVSIATVFDALVKPQDVFFTATVRVTTPEAPAVNVIVFELIDDVIVPPLIPHVIVLSGTGSIEAVLAAELAQTAAGALIVTSGGVLIVTIVLAAVALPQLLRAVARSLTVPLNPAL